MGDASGYSYTAVPKVGANAGSSLSVTVEKRDASGALVWTTTLLGDGSDSCPRTPRLLGVADDGRLGAALPFCPPGSPPGTAWDVVLLDSSGAVSSRYVTGVGEVLAMNGFGEVYAAAADVGATVPLPDPKKGWPNGSPFVMRLIRADGSDAWVDRVRRISQLRAVQTTSDGGAVGLNDASGSWDTALTRIDRTGTALWTTDLPVTVFGSSALAVMKSGELAIAIAGTGALQFGGAQVGAAGQQETRAVLVVAPDGTPRTAVALPDASSGAAYASLIATALPEGGVVVAEGDASCPHLYAFSADLSPRWNRSVDASCAASITSVARSVAASSTGVLLVTYASGPADFLGGRTTNSAGFYLLDIAP